MGKLFFKHDMLKDDHIFRLTDDTGMLQHSKYSLPDPGQGFNYGPDAL